MYEQEKKRATLLMILLVYTFLSIALIGESLLMGWDTGAVVLLIVGLISSWVIYMTEKIPDSIRIWLYFIFTMLAFFFYGIHETSIYDMAPLMLVIIIMYSTVGKYSIIRLCVITYILTMCYDFLFVLSGSMELTSLVVTRTILHFVLVYLAGVIAKIIIQRRIKEKSNTDKKIAELEEINRRTEDFLTNVSHELRTPVNAVTGITAVMLKGEEDIEKRKNILSVQKAGNRLFDQIEDILDYTEIDTGRIKVSEDTYMITSLVNDIIAGNHLTEREDMPELIFDIDIDMPSVLFGDGKKIKKILKHLIDNSIKFTQKGGIYVRVFTLQKPYGINLCIKVSDTGCGIAEDELESITERFYQSSGGRNRRAGGLGLGLPIVCGLVNAMKGFIQIESTEGSGTTVSVSIPQKVPEEATSMMVANRENFCLACYLIPEKYEVPEVRDYYNEMISHMVQKLDIPLHRVSNMDELKTLISMYHLTHLFIGREEYEENSSYFEGMDPSVEIIVVADNSFTLPKGSRVKLLRKPFFCLPIINILNAGASQDTDILEKKQMVCPGVKVLVVDDEPMNLMVAEGIFKDYQMTVKVAESGRSAIALCEKEDFDLIFLDHMMPEMDGVETLKRIRKIQADQNKTFTIVAFTANAVSGAREMFLREGFDEFVSKPIELMEMERILKKVLPKSSITYIEESDKDNLELENIDRPEISNAEEIMEEKQIQESDSKEDKINLLEKVGIHTHSGIQYCRGDREFYAELLTKFAKDADRKEKEMQDFFQKEDYKNYSILVHALKSTAKMIGADTLSENARYAEEAAKNLDADYILEHHDELLMQYHQIVQCINNVLELDAHGSIQMEQENIIEISDQELIQRLEELKEGLHTFEVEKAESLLSKMREIVYKGTPVSELLYEVQLEVDDFEFGTAAEKVEDLIRKVEGGDM